MDLVYLFFESIHRVLQILQFQRVPSALRVNYRPFRRCLQSIHRQELLALTVIGDIRPLKYLEVQLRIL